MNEQFWTGLVESRNHPVAVHLDSLAATKKSSTLGFLHSVRVLEDKSIVFLEVFRGFYASKLSQNGFQMVKPRFSGVLELPERFFEQFSWNFIILKEIFALFSLKTTDSRCFLSYFYKHLS